MTIPHGGPVPNEVEGETVQMRPAFRSRHPPLSPCRIFPLGRGDRFRPIGRRFAGNRGRLRHVEGFGARRKTVDAIDRQAHEFIEGQQALVEPGSRVTGVRGAEAANLVIDRFVDGDAGRRGKSFRKPASRLVEDDGRLRRPAHRQSDVKALGTGEEDKQVVVVERRVAVEKERGKASGFVQAALQIVWPVDVPPEERGRTRANKALRGPRRLQVGAEVGAVGERREVGFAVEIGRASHAA